MVRDLVLGRPFATWRITPLALGMSPWHDLVDWLGGNPFEVARPEEVIGFYTRRGFTLVTAETCGRCSGCNEFVFAKAGE